MRYKIIRVVSKACPVCGLDSSFLWGWHVTDNSKAGGVIIRCEACRTVTSEEYFGRDGVTCRQSHTQVAAEQLLERIWACRRTDVLPLRLDPLSDSDLEETTLLLSQLWGCSVDRDSAWPLPITLYFTTPLHPSTYVKFINSMAVYDGTAFRALRCNHPDLADKFDLPMQNTVLFPMSGLQAIVG